MFKPGLLVQHLMIIGPALYIENFLKKVKLTIPSFQVRISVQHLLLKIFSNQANLAFKGKVSFYFKNDIFWSPFEQNNGLLLVSFLLKMPRKPCWGHCIIHLSNFGGKWTGFFFTCIMHIIASFFCMLHHNRKHEENALKYIKVFFDRKYMNVLVPVY